MESEEGWSFSRMSNVDCFVVLFRGYLENHIFLIKLTLPTGT